MSTLKTPNYFSKSNMFRTKRVVKFWAFKEFVIYDCISGTIHILYFSTILFGVTRQRYFISSKIRSHSETPKICLPHSPALVPIRVKGKDEFDTESMRKIDTAEDLHELLLERPFLKETENQGR